MNQTILSFAFLYTLVTAVFIIATSFVLKGIQEKRGNWVAGVAAFFTYGQAILTTSLIPVVLLSAVLAFIFR